MSTSTVTRCEHCGTSQREVCWSEQAGESLCLHCYREATSQGNRHREATSQGNRSLTREPRETTAREPGRDAEQPSPPYPAENPSDPSDPLVPLCSLGSLVRGEETARSLVRSGVHVGLQDVDRLALAWGGEEGGSLPCPLPGHDGQACIEAAEQDPEVPRLRCCHGRWRSLGEVHAARAYGHDGKRSNIEIATWTLRLAWELGTFAPKAAELPAVAGLSAHAERVRDGFVLLAGLRWAEHPPRPLPYSIRFVAAWCGVSFTVARLALAELLKADVIREVERHKRTPLYLPGATGLLVDEGYVEARSDAFAEKALATFPGSYEIEVDS